MRNVLRNHNEVAHFWANGIQPSGRAGNMYFQDSTIYSYGGHFPMARRLTAEHGPLLGQQIILFTTRRYSSSTSKHLSLTRRAIHDGVTIIRCRDVRASNASQHRANLDAMIGDITELSDTAKRARSNRPYLIAHACEVAEQFNRYAMVFGLDARLDEEAPDVAGWQQQSAAMLAVIEADRQRAARLADEAQQQRLDSWVIGASDYAPHTQTIRLRVKGERIETSWGADIPVSDAVAMWALLPNLAGSDRIKRLQIRLGAYPLDKVEPDLSIVAGCHRIAGDELRRIAGILGLPQHEEVAAA